MSQDSTKVPGISGNSDYNNLYNRQQGAQSYPSAPHGTIVPGMNRVAPMVEERAPKTVKPQVPVVGFLYSISRQGVGEYWPLHIGSNSIGRLPSADVCLPELTVSEKHASLNIKQLKSTRKILASIRDEGSKNGIYVNDDELDYDSHPVKNHDIITIGDNYKLLLLLIDAEEMGLSIAENFQPADVEEEEPDPLPFPAPNPNDTDSLYNPANRVENGTVAMDGSAPVTNGRTRFL